MNQMINLPDFGAFADAVLPPAAETLPGAAVPAMMPPIPSQDLSGITPLPIAAAAQGLGLIQGHGAPDQTQASHHGIDWASLIGPLMTIGLAATGHPNAAIGAGHGTLLAQQQQREEALRRYQLETQRRQEERLQAEQERIRKGQEAAAAAAQAAHEAARQKDIGSFITDVSKTVRQFKTKAERDEFVQTMDGVGANYYGLRPGAVASAVPAFVPAQMQERAKATLDTYRKLAAQQPGGFVETGDGTNSMVKRGPMSLDTLSVQFDVDGDGKLETVPYRKLEEYAGEAFYDASGNRLATQAAPKAQTYGEVFPQARGTVLADKPLPVTGKGIADYSQALTDLGKLGMLPSATERQTARHQAEQHARDELYGAMLEPGTTDADLAARFSQTFSKMGLSFRAEVGKIRRQLFSVGRQTIGSEDLPPEDPAEYIDRGRRVLGGGAGKPSNAAPAVTVPAPAASPAPAPRGASATPRPAARPTGKQPYPTTTPANDYLKLRDVARSVLYAEAQRQGRPTNTITEDVIRKFIETPGNKEKLLNAGRR
jgi:hypothetical protein